MNTLRGFTALSGLVWPAVVAKTCYKLYDLKFHYFSVYPTKLSHSEEPLLETTHFKNVTVSFFNKLLLTPNSLSDLFSLFYWKKKKEKKVASTSKDLKHAL